MRGWRQVGLVLLWCAALPAVADSDDKRRELEALQQRIGDLQETIDRTRGQKDELLEELETTERGIGELARTLRAMDLSITERGRELERLQRERSTKDADLARQRGLLARQIRAAHASGRQERLKLLLSQDDPGLMSRVMAYYGYLSRARAGRIRGIRDRVRALLELEQTVTREQEQLAALRLERQGEQQRLQASYARRRELLAGLEQTLREKGERLGGLKQDAAALARLIKRLERAAVRSESQRPVSLREAKGQLNWPVKGRLSARFGTPRAVGGLVWDGVVISAPAGREVHALHHGRVAFADWLRGFGLLLILDHGDGYMSLYGFNQSLLKETGEWVEQGEPIALVGDSGGRARTGLYFGIRRNGRPENPRRWCRTAKSGKTG